MRKLRFLPKGIGDDRKSTTSSIDSYRGSGASCRKALAMTGTMHFLMIGFFDRRYDDIKRFID